MKLITGASGLLGGEILALFPGSVCLTSKIARRFAVSDEMLINLIAGVV